MLKQNNEYRASARQQLAGKWMITVLIILISYILTQAFQANSGIKYSYVNGELVHRTSGAFVNFGALINFILAGPIALGITTYFLKLARGENAIIEDIFSGFKNFGNSFLLNLLVIIFVALWSAIFIIPGAILGIVFFVKQSFGMLVLTIIIFGIASSVSVIIAGLRYSMAYYILNDNPEISSIEAIRRSKEMMKGNKGKLFMLMLSFIGWFILGLLALVIGLLWVSAYYSTAKANFYEDLKQSYVRVESL